MFPTPKLMGLAKRSEEMGLLTSPECLKFHGSQSRNNCRNQGFKCPRSVVAFLSMLGESSQLSERPCRGSFSTNTGWKLGRLLRWPFGIVFGGVDSDRWIDGLEPFECRFGSPSAYGWAGRLCRR
jgi:hypothetical protein